ncbi:MAG: rhodanese-like domain-containing protein [Synechococcaceae cyanobacterium]|nr:rhodanese-like domain-containing protein [Synechococcaceae cyanobacterium]
MTLTPPVAAPDRLSPHELAERRRRGQVVIVDVREPMEYVGGHIPGSLNIPLGRLDQAPLPEGPLVLVCQSGNRSSRAREALRARGHHHPVADLEGGVPAWRDAGYPVEARRGAPLPLMRQVQIVAGGMVLLGVVLSLAVAPAWIALTAFVGAGLVFAGLTGACPLAGLLGRMPWNRVDS